MKIAILIWRDLKNPEAGGSELYFHELAKVWIKEGNEVTWFSSSFKGALNEEFVDGIKIIRSGKKFGVYLATAKSYLQQKEKYDITIDVENGIPFFTPFYVSGKKVLHIHHVHRDVWFKELPLPLALIGWFLETKMMKFAYRKIPVISLSKSSAEEISQLFGHKKANLVNPGIEFVKYKKYGKDKKPTILFVNRIKKYKGVDCLLRGVKEINKSEKGKEISFLIAGSGDYLEEAKRYAKNNNLNNVNFLGRISEEKKYELMQKCWVFVNPSFKEGWGIVNIEANYFGTPVLGSNVGGIRDSVVDGKTGVLFEYGNEKDLAVKLLSLIKNKKKLDNMSKNCKKWSMNFSWDKKGREYLEVLKRLAKR